MQDNKLKYYGVTIYLNDNQKTDLNSLLRIVGDSGKHSSWRAYNVECVGDSAEILHRLSDDEKEIFGEEFYNIVSNIYQTLDGYFEAFKPDETSYWLSIRAVDGTEFDIETEDYELLNRIRESFPNVKDLNY